MAKTQRVYPGLAQDTYGGMTPTGHIVRDAQVFGLISQQEDCAGWTLERIERLYDQVTAAWLPYGHLASRLPAELQERHQRLYAAAIEQARALGWDADVSDEE